MSSCQACGAETRNLYQHTKSRVQLVACDARCATVAKAGVSRPDPSERSRILVDPAHPLAHTAWCRPKPAGTEVSIPASFAVPILAYMERIGQPVQEGEEEERPKRSVEEGAQVSQPKRMMTPVLPELSNEVLVEIAKNMTFDEWIMFREEHFDIAMAPDVVAAVINRSLPRRVPVSFEEGLSVPVDLKEDLTDVQYAAKMAAFMTHVHITFYWMDSEVRDTILRGLDMPVLVTIFNKTPGGTEDELETLKAIVSLPTINQDRNTTRTIFSIMCLKQTHQLSHYFFLIRGNRADQSTQLAFYLSLSSRPDWHLHPEIVRDILRHRDVTPLDVAAAFYASMYDANVEWKNPFAVTKDIWNLTVWDILKKEVALGNVDISGQVIQTLLVNFFDDDAYSKDMSVIRALGYHSWQPNWTDSRSNARSVDKEYYPFTWEGMKDENDDEAEAIGLWKNEITRLIRSIPQSMPFAAPAAASIDG